MGGRNTCDFCGDSLDASPWLMLNRYGVGTGRARCLTEIRVDGEYVWDLDEEGEDFATNVTLHWPGCASMWIEAKMVEVDKLAGSGSE